MARRGLQTSNLLSAKRPVMISGRCASLPALIRSSGPTSERKDFTNTKSKDPHNSIALSKVSDIVANGKERQRKTDSTN